MSVAEITVRIKSEDTIFTERFLCYEPFECSLLDPILKGYIDQVLWKIQHQLIDPDIVVKIKMQWV